MSEPEQKKPTAQNVESIPFNNSNLGFKEPEQITMVTVGGVPERIHDTNNLQVKTNTFFRLKDQAAGVPNPYEEFDAAYVEPFKEKKFDEIFAELATRYPGLYQQLVEFYKKDKEGNLEEIEGPPEERQELQNYKKKIYSMAFDGLCEVAHELDPQYETNYFWE